MSLFELESNTQSIRKLILISLIRNFVFKILIGWRILYEKSSFKHVLYILKSFVHKRNKNTTFDFQNILTTKSYIQIMNIVEIFFFTTVISLIASGIPVHPINSIMVPLF